MKTALAVFGGIILIIIIGVAVSPSGDDQSSTTGLTPAAQPEQEQTKVEVKSHRVSEGGTIVGEVINNRSSGATFVEITATLYDANGEVVGTDFTYVSTTVDAPLEPGTTAPFELILYDQPDFDTYKLDVTWN